MPSFFRRWYELEIMNMVSDFDEIDLEDSKPPQPFPPGDIFSLALDRKG